MSNHATRDERAAIASLEARLNPVDSPIEELLDLAVYYLCPCHEGAKAYALLEAILRREPHQGEAKIWLGHAAAHELMDKGSLTRAYALLREEIAAHGRHAAAAAFLAAYVGQQLAVADGSEERRLLELSVELEPTWVYNQEMLARRYAASGETQRALQHLERAVANIVEPADYWSHRRREFEVEITGRAAHRVRESLGELRTKLVSSSPSPS